MTVEEAVKANGRIGMSGALVKMLQSSLYRDEEPLDGFTTMAKVGSDTVEAVVLITTHRVLCCTRVLIRKELREIPLKEIRGLQIRNGEGLWKELHIQSLTENIVIVDSPTEVRVIQYSIQWTLDNIWKLETPIDEDITVESIEISKEEDMDKIQSQLRALKQMVDEALITPEEFEAKKKQVLGL